MSTGTCPSRTQRVRYIDLNPVRARKTGDPVSSTWSSCVSLCGLGDDPSLTLHPVQRTLSPAAYRAMLAEAISEEALTVTRLSCGSNAGTAATTSARRLPEAASTDGLVSPDPVLQSGTPDRGRLAKGDLWAIAFSDWCCTVAAQQITIERCPAEGLYLG